MSDNQDNMEQMAMAFYVYAAELIKEGISEEDIIDILMQRGLSQESATMVMRRLDESRDNVSRKNAYPSIVFGAVLIVMSLFPLFGVIVEQVEGLSLIIALIMMATGIVIAGRGLMQAFF